MNFLKRKTQKVHKIKAKKHITFMMIPDPTKAAKVVKIPKWVRFPMYLLLIVMVWGILNTIEHIAQLQSVVAENQYELLVDDSVINEKVTTIVELENTNRVHSEKLEEYKSLSDELDQKLAELEAYKEALDTKLNGAEDPQPSEAPVVVQADAMVTLDQESTEVGDVSAQSVEDPFNTEIDALINKVKTALEDLEDSQTTFEALNTQVDELIPYWEAYPSGKPVDYLYVTSPLGWRRDPITRRWDYHTGVDFGVSYEAVYSTGKGTVVSAGWEPSYGYTIEINHGYGYRTRYAHLYKLYVQVGDEVVRGQKIATSGSSGRSTGPHLHYEVLYYGEYQDPMDYIE